MAAFFIDKQGDHFDNEKDKISDKLIEEDEDDFLNPPIIDLPDLLPESLNVKKTKPSKNIYDLNDTYLIISYKNRSTEESSSHVDKLLAKSSVKGCLEQRHSVPVEKPKKVLIKQRRRLREKTKGKDWFDMPKTKVSQEIRTDFELLKMRSVLDKNHVYKKNDITRVPKYFQVGTVVESPADFYGGRIPKSQRKKTIVDELLADAEFKKYQKKKFKEIMDDNRRNKRKINVKKKGVQQKTKKGKSKR